MNRISVEPTCRYQHGPLLCVSKMGGVATHYGLLMYKGCSLEPGSLNGLSAWVCEHCGYMEIFDDDAIQTMKNMEPANE
jgi:hypothetical protein